MAIFCFIEKIWELEKQNNNKSRTEHDNICYFINHNSLLYATIMVKQNITKHNKNTLDIFDIMFNIIGRRVLFKHENKTTLKELVKKSLNS